jgi:hypothetical protein
MLQKQVQPIGDDMRFLDITNILALSVVEISFPASTIQPLFRVIPIIHLPIVLTWLNYRFLVKPIH